MKASELRKIIKEMIIAQNGKLYNYNINNIVAVYGVDSLKVTNTINYFRFSPAQADFRSTYNFK